MPEAKVGKEAETYLINLYYVVEKIENYSTKSFMNKFYSTYQFCRMAELKSMRDFV